MRKMTMGALLFVLWFAVQGSSTHAAVSADESGTVVIVFKDGHRQSIPASSITAMEFQSAAGVVTPIAIPELAVPGRGVFAGKWSVGEGNGNSDRFYITLE